MTYLCAIDLQPIVGIIVGLVAVIIGWYLLLVVGAILIRAPIVTVAALVKGKALDEDAAWVAFWESVVLVIVLIWALFHFHVVKWG
jgi:membrane protein DedA with SNARE-associated domain